MKLPSPQYDGGTSVEKALRERRSVREFSRDSLTLEQVSQLLWAAQGATHGDGYRTCPSAGALYPLELYIVSGSVRNLPPGLYHYRPLTHDVERTVEGDLRGELSKAAMGQEAVRNAAAVLVLTAVSGRTTAKYGRRGERYVDFEVGHAAQNILLQAAALDLGAVPVGAFQDSTCKSVLNLPASEEPKYLLPVGLR
jgi:SagB-type dehydrogenase family enzyme